MQLILFRPGAAGLIADVSECAAHFIHLMSVCSSIGEFIAGKDNLSLFICTKTELYVSFFCTSTCLSTLISVSSIS